MKHSLLDYSSLDKHNKASNHALHGQNGVKRIIDSFSAIIFWNILELEELEGMHTETVFPMKSGEHRLLLDDRLMTTSPTCECTCWSLNPSLVPPTSELGGGSTCCSAPIILKSLSPCLDDPLEYSQILLHELLFIQTGISLPSSLSSCTLKEERGY